VLVVKKYYLKGHFTTKHWDFGISYPDGSVAIENPRFNFVIFKIKEIIIFKFNDGRWRLMRVA